MWKKDFVYWKYVESIILRSWVLIGSQCKLVFYFVHGGGGAFRPPPPPPPPTPLIPQMKVDFVWMWIPPMGNARNLRSTVTHARPSTAPGAAAPGFHFQLEALSMRESKESEVVCLRHAGRRSYFRLSVSSSVGQCCQHFWVGWGPNWIKGGLGRGKCQQDKQAVQIFLGRLQLDDADVVVYKGSKTPRLCCRAVERACFGCARSVALVTSIIMAGGACKCGLGSLVHRRKFDRSHSDAAVLCAGVSFSWARPTQQPKRKLGIPKDLVERSSLSFCCRELICDSEVRASRLVPASLPTRTNHDYI